MKKIIISFFILLISQSAFAADQVIEMLNKLGKENMVYSQKIVNIEVGDSIIWKSTTKGHNVEFIKGGTPDGVEKFKSKINKDAQYKFKIPGIYAYWCTPHKGMGMIGFVVVGNDKSNLESVKTIKYLGKSKKIAQELISSL